MASGKLDKEPARISANATTPTTPLLNESLASTNELEGAKIARQILAALHERGIRLCFVARLYEFAHGLFEDAGTAGTLFLRAESRDDGARMFRLVQGEPLETSYGADL